MVSDLKRRRPVPGRGANGGRRHHRSGAKRTASATAVGHSDGLLATARADRSASLTAGIAPTAAL